METHARSEQNLNQLSAREAAEHFVAEHAGKDNWLDDFSEHLDRYRSAQSLKRCLSVWGLSQSEAARAFQVSRQAVSKWLEQGVPSERAQSIADMAAATDVLVHHLKRDRIPAVVRRPAAALNKQSLLNLFHDGDSAAVLRACRAMFSFGQVQSQ